MKVYLDDLRQAPDGWKRTYTARGCIYLLKNDTVTHLSLDHDLGNPEHSGTGYDVMLWIEEKAYTDSSFSLPVITFHTANPWGRRRMEQSLASTLKLLDESSSQRARNKPRNNRRNKLMRDNDNGTEKSSRGSRNDAL